MSNSIASPGNGRKAIVWQTGDYLPAILAKLKEQDWQIQAIVTESTATSDIGGLPVVQPRELDGTVDAATTIFPGDVAPESASKFIDLLSGFRDRTGLTNKIVHPAVFADSHKYSRPRFLVTGLPGSGNMIAQTLYNEMIEGRQAANFSQLDQGLIGLASSYFWSLHNLVKTGLEKRGAAYWHVTPWETVYGAFVTGPTIETETWQMCGLPLRSHLWSVDLTFSHEAPTKETIKYFADHNISVLSLVRHPLDNIISIAGKMARDSGLDNPGILLCNPEWYRSMVEAVSNHFAAILAQQSADQIFYYEDLLSDPVGYMSKVKSVLGVEFGPEQMKRAWDQFGLKPLPTAMGHHFWKPSEGKWRDYMSPMQKDIILASKLPALTRELGYDLDGMDGNYEADVQRSHLAEAPARALAYWDCFYSHFLPKQRTLEHPAIKLMTNRNKVSAYGYDTETLNLSDYFSNLLESELFDEVISASHLGDAPAPRWTTRADLSGTVNSSQQGA